MAVEAVLTGILLTALRTNHIRVLVTKMNIFDVALEGHLVKI